jgi:hypothetical protein
MTMVFKAHALGRLGDRSPPAPKRFARFRRLGARLGGRAPPAL